MALALSTVRAVNPVEAPVVQGRKVKKVLLVDDYELFLKQWTREFAREEIPVVIATNKHDALVQVAREHPDVAVVDLFLSPPDTGIEVIRAIKAVDPTIFCVLASAHLSVAYTVLAIRAGADDVFLKPFTATTVLQRVESGVPSEPEQNTPTLDQIEWEHISRVLMDHDGNISAAAEALGVFRQSLQRKIARYAPRALKIEPPKPAKPRNAKSSKPATRKGSKKSARAQRPS